MDSGEGPNRRGNMAAVAINDANQTESKPQRNRLLRILDALAEWLMREELRIISRSRSRKSGRG